MHVQTCCFNLLLFWRQSSCRRRRRRKLETLRSEDGDSGENIAEKVNSRSFNFHRDYSKSLTLSNVGESS